MEIEEYDLVIQTKTFYAKHGGRSPVDKKKTLVSRHVMSALMLKECKDKGKLINTVIEQHAMDLKVETRKRYIDELKYGID